MVFARKLAQEMPMSTGYETDLHRSAYGFADSGRCQDFWDVEMELLACGFSAAAARRATADVATREALDQRCTMAKLGRVGELSQAHIGRCQPPSTRSGVRPAARAWGCQDGRPSPNRETVASDVRFDKD